MSSINYLLGPDTAEYKGKLAETSILDILISLSLLFHHPAHVLSSC